MCIREYKFFHFRFRLTIRGYKCILLFFSFLWRNPRNKLRNYKYILVCKVVKRNVDLHFYFRVYIIHAYLNVEMCILNVKKHKMFLLI